MVDYEKVRRISSAALKGSSATEVEQPDDVSLGLALTIVHTADERKASDISLLDVSGVSYLADYFVIMTGFSNIQVRAIARSIQDRVHEQWGRSPRQIEGTAEGSWVLLDYGDVIVHIFMPQEREFYNLEAFWGHAERIDWSAISISPDSLD
ncbi:MAG: ribosome silencing factor [Elainellaceae cyanobacterium]